MYICSSQKIKSDQPKHPKSNTPNLGRHEKLSLLLLFKSKMIVSQKDA